MQASPPLPAHTGRFSDVCLPLARTWSRQCSSAPVSGLNVREKAGEVRECASGNRSRFVPTCLVKGNSISLKEQLEKTDMSGRSRESPG